MTAPKEGTAGVSRRNLAKAAAALALTAACAPAGPPEPSPTRGPTAATLTSRPGTPPDAASRTKAPSTPARDPGTAAEIRHGDRRSATVALTFHGAGDVAVAEAVLRAVEREGRRASVLAVGTWLAQNPHMAQRILGAGHDLGNHTMHHYPMLDLSAAVATQEVVGCSRELRRLTGSQGQWFRASGTQRTTSVIRRAAARAGYSTCVSYDVDGLDWLDPPAATVIDAVLSGARGGSIVSLHLGHAVTPRALPHILRGLRDRHLEPVTLTEMLA